MTRECSLEMADLLLHDHTRCAICGIPNYIIRRLTRIGIWLLGGPKENTHLTCDHIVAGGTSDRANLRPLCCGCNMKKQDDACTDEEVLQWARFRWPWVFQNKQRKLWWLNTHIDDDGVAVGGTLFRSPRTEANERRIRGEKG